MSKHAPNSQWTPERVERLKTLWAEGKSANQVAVDMACGFSRSSVLGKVSRLKLPARAKDVSHTTKAQRSDARGQRVNGNKGQPKANAIVHNVRAMRALPPRPLPDDEIDAGIDASHLIGIMSLNDSRCRWPMGPATGSAQLFCGVKKSRHAGPYCPEHTRRSEPQR